MGNCSEGFIYSQICGYTNTVSIITFSTLKFESGFHSINGILDFATETFAVGVEAHTLPLALRKRKAQALPTRSVCLCLRQAAT
jgi:hypothetical protein